MGENNIIFVKKYFNKELLVFSENIIFETFLKQSNLDFSSVLTENSCVKNGDFLLLNNQHFLIHIVKPGETLEFISNKYKVSVEHVKNLNKFDKIFIGQQLLI